MKLERTQPAAQRPPATTGGQPTAHAAAGQVAPVDASSGVDPDRERSLRQELDSVEAMAVGDFHGEARILADAHSLAMQLAASHGEHLIRPAFAAHLMPHVDDNA